MKSARNILWLTHRACRGALSRLRNFYYRALGVKINGYVWMRAIEIPRNWADITLENNVALDTGVTLLSSGAPRRDKLVIRSGTYVNRYTVFDAHERLEVGADCMIGPHCYITDADHGKACGTPVARQGMERRPVVIEDEVWLGAGVVILPGVRIGKGAIIGASSVVTGNIPGNAIAAGSPAREIGARK